MKVPGAKWSEAEIADVLSRRARGETYPSIAASYGVQDSTIRKTVKAYGGGSSGQSRVVADWSPPEQASQLPWVEGGHVEPAAEPIVMRYHGGPEPTPGPFIGAPDMRPVSRSQSASGSAAPLYGAGPGSSPGGGSIRPRPDPFKLLADLCRRGPQTLEALCDALDLPPGKARKAVADAQAAGYTIAMAGDSYALQAPDEIVRPSKPVAVRPVTGNRFMLGVCSDLHFGSLYCLRDQLADYVKAAYAQGVRTMVCAGDVLDGVYHHSMFEQSRRGWDEQAQDCFENLPRFDGLEWNFIDGNHDFTYHEKTGAESGARLEDYFARKGRTDLHYLGARAGGLDLQCSGVVRPVRVHLWHPKPGRAYALSYHIQKKIEAYAPGTKPDVLICGHWHTAVYLETRGIHSLAAGCFQGPGSAFSKSLPGGASIGAWVMSWQLTKDGTMRRVSVERTAYYHREESRAVAMEPAA